MLDLDERKKQLEVEKLEDDIKRQKKPFLFISNYAKVFVIFFQLFTGFVAFLFAYKNGWFNQQQEKLELRKMQLEVEIQNFTQTKQNILDSIGHYRSVNDSFFDLVNDQEKRLELFKSENSALLKYKFDHADIEDSLNNIISPRKYNYKLGNYPYRYPICGLLRDQNQKKKAIRDAEITVVFFRPGSDRKPFFVQKAKSDNDGFFYTGINDDNVATGIKISISKNGYRDTSFQSIVWDLGLPSYPSIAYLRKL